MEFCPMYCSINDFYFDFSSVTMVLAVDAGHQMKKDKVVFYMFLTISGGGSQWEWKNFIKGEYGAIKQKEVVHQFVDKDGKRCF
jgi:cytochrome c oxidase subunit 3